MSHTAPYPGAGDGCTRCMEAMTGRERGARRGLSGDAPELALLPPDAREFVLLAARTSLPVLLLGETGTGKTRLARLIHQYSDRASAPFVHVNCGSIPEGLFERELFGHVRGAFTDARDSREGLFEESNGGTLLLDEIGELPASVQPKLLSALEERSIRRLGSPRPVEVEIRLITATNRDVRRMMAESSFREDLYYRCSVLEFTLRPLRERRGDIPALTAKILDHLSGLVKDEIRIADTTLDLLCSYDWPGNIRELQNVLQRAALNAPGAVLEPQHIPSDIRQPRGCASPRGHRGPARPPRYRTPPDPHEEKARIVEALRAEDGARTRAAERLGMSRATLWIKMRLYGISS